MPLPQTTLHDALVVSTRRYPDKTVMRFGADACSYRVLLSRVEALAGHLQSSCGVRRGDRVLLYLQNSPQFVMAYYAVLRADAVVVPVNPMNLADELGHCARDAIVGEELLDRVVPMLERVQFDRVILDGPIARGCDGVVGWGDALARCDTPAASMARPDDLAVLAYTSGTTGRPKGCMLTHRNLVAVSSVAGMLHGQHVGDVMLAAAPFFHVTGMQMLMNNCIHLGAEMVIMRRWDRELALDLIERHGVTSWTNIPTMVMDLLASPNASRGRLASLRYIGGGGAAMPEAVAERLLQLTGLTYLEGYGLTETAAPTHSNPLSSPRRQCLGRPNFNTHSHIVRPGTAEILAPNEVGEIVSSGPQVFQGYWNDPDASAQAFVDIEGRRFFRTGDLGRVDDEGYFYLVDRLKRMINAAGYKVWPAEVESLLYAHPDVVEACVVGARDARRGETVKAYVVLRPERQGKVSEEEIIAWARGRMAAYKVPRIVVFAPSLPKTSSGKVQWQTLQQVELG